MSYTTQPQAVARHRVCLCTPHIGHTSAPDPVSSRSILHPTKACPTQGKKRRLPLTCTQGAPYKKQKLLARTLREAQQEAFSKDSEDSKRGQADLPPDPQNHVWTEKVLWPHLRFSMKWPGKQASWMLRYMRCRRLGLASWGTYSCQSHCRSLPKRHTVFPCMVMPTKLPNIMGLKGIHCLGALDWWVQLLLLSPVWKGRTEWRHSCKPPEDHALLPGPGM